MTAETVMAKREIFLSMVASSEFDGAVGDGVVSDG
jgi:hypothetical protein